MKDQMRQSRGKQRLCDNLIGREISAKAQHFAKSTKPDANEKYEEHVAELRQILLFEQQNLKEMYASSVDFLSTTPSKISSVEAYVSFVTNVNRLDFTIRINIGKLQGALEAYSDVLSSKLENTDDTDHEGIAKISAEIDLLETAKKEFVAHVERYRDASPIVRQHIINAKEAVIPKSEEQFDLALAKLKIKVGELNQKAEAEAAKYPAKLEDDKTHDYRAASAAANALLKSLEQSRKGFYSEHGGTCLWDFKEECKDAISEARKELKHHRGWGQVLGTLAFALTVCLSGGSALLASKFITGSWTFFNLKTDSEDTLDEFAQDFQLLTTP